MRKSQNSGWHRFICAASAYTFSSDKPIYFRSVFTCLTSKRWLSMGKYERGGNPTSNRSLCLYNRRTMRGVVNNSCYFVYGSFKRGDTEMVKLFLDFIQRVSLFDQRKKTSNRHTSSLSSS